ncbi:MAG TPA: ferredoxin [Polyangiaceae bacterium]|jgi:ferredoxin|nr:ferredoxin [Polyangiaceae bacterium]
MASLRIVVDRDLCEANGECMRAAPEVFLVDDNDKLVVKVERPAAELVEKVRTAVRRCPRAALTLRED